MDNLLIWLETQQQHDYHQHDTNIKQPHWAAVAQRGGFEPDTAERAREDFYAVVLARLIDCSAKLKNLAPS